MPLTWKSTVEPTLLAIALVFTIAAVGNQSWVHGTATVSSVTPWSNKFGSCALKNPEYSITAACFGMAVQPLPTSVQAALQAIGVTVSQSSISVGIIGDSASTPYQDNWEVYVLATTTNDRNTIMQAVYANRVLINTPSAGTQPTHPLLPTPPYTINALSTLSVDIGLYSVCASVDLNCSVLPFTDKSLCQATVSPQLCVSITQACKFARDSACLPDQPVAAPTRNIEYPSRDANGMCQRALAGSILLPVSLGLQVLSLIVISLLTLKTDASGNTGDDSVVALSFSWWSLLKGVLLLAALATEIAGATSLGAALTQANDILQGYVPREYLAGGNGPSDSSSSFSLPLLGFNNIEDIKFAGGTSLVLAIIAFSVFLFSCLVAFARFFILITKIVRMYAALGYPPKPAYQERMGLLHSASGGYGGGASGPQVP